MSPDGVPVSVQRVAILLMTLFGRAVITDGWLLAIPTRVGWGAGLVMDVAVLAGMPAPIIYNKV